MATQDLGPQLLKVREEVWRLAQQCLDQEQIQVYRGLTEIAERLTSFSRVIQERLELSKGAMSSKSLLKTPVFARYKGARYDAELDMTRINGGRGACIMRQGKMLTPSKAAHEITGTSVNGWRFWKYHRPDRTEGMIDELR